MLDDIPLVQGENQSSETALESLEQEAPELPFKEILASLVLLQTKDSEIAARRAQIETALEAIQEQKNLLEQSKHEFEGHKERANKLLLERKSLEGDLAKKEEEIRKCTGDLQAIKSNDAYKALLTQIENIKIEKNKFEDRILQVLEDTDLEKKSQQETQKVFENKTKEVELAINKITAEEKELQITLARLQQERQGLVAKVPPEAFKRYERLSKKKEGLAVAVVEGSACGGCSMNLTQGILNELLKIKDFVYCERCQRILYIP